MDALVGIVFAMSTALAGVGDESQPLLTADAITKLIAFLIGVLVAYFVQTIVLSTMANGAWSQVSDRRRSGMARMGGVAATIAGLIVLTTDPTQDAFQIVLHLWLAQVIAGAAGARAVQGYIGRMYPEGKEGDSNAN